MKLVRCFCSLYREAIRPPDFLRVKRNTEMTLDLTRVIGTEGTDVCMNYDTLQGTYRVGYLNASSRCLCHIIVILQSTELQMCYRVLLL